MRKLFLGLVLWASIANGQFFESNNNSFEEDLSTEQSFHSDYSDVPDQGVDNGAGNPAEPISIDFYIVVLGIIGIGIGYCKHQSVKTDNIKY